MRKRSGYLVNQIAQEFEFRVRLTRPGTTDRPDWEAKAVTRRIVYWTQGHTFLTYRIYQLILEQSERDLAGDLAGVPPGRDLPGRDLPGRELAGRDLLGRDLLEGERVGGEATDLPTDRPLVDGLGEVVQNEASESSESSEGSESGCLERLWVDKFVETRILERCRDPEIIRHLRNICKFMIQTSSSAELLALYQQVLQGDRPAIKGGNDLHRRLLQSGLARPEAGHLVLGNRLYARIFDTKWVRRAERTIAAQLAGDQATAGREVVAQVALNEIEPKPAFDEALLASSRHLASTIEPSRSLAVQLQSRLVGASWLGRLALTLTVSVAAGALVAGALLGMTTSLRESEAGELVPPKSLAPSDAKR